MIKVVLVMLLMACVATGGTKKGKIHSSTEENTISPESEYKICRKYEKNKEYNLSFPCYQRLSTTDYSKAYVGLADAYENGYGTKKNLNRARKYYEKAAENGSGEAAMKLALAYQTENNDVDAFKWYKKAADNGDAKAAFAISHMYAAGKGTVKNEEQSKYWLTISASGGFAHSQYLMGRMEYNRYLITKDNDALKKAEEWLKKSSRQGNAEAKKMLNTLPK